MSGVTLMGDMSTPFKDCVMRLLGDNEMELAELVETGSLTIRFLGKQFVLVLTVDVVT